MSLFGTPVSTGPVCKLDATDLERDVSAFAVRCAHQLIFHFGHVAASEFAVRR
jgi:hypothetical protein